MMRLFVAAVVGFVLVSRPAVGQEMPAVDPAAIDAIFGSFDTTRSPGCAVGVSSAGRIVLEQAYGMANLEHDVANRPETIFEPGSVSKQFTAAATLMLALDGTISLDDDIRTYLPEVPVYEAPITVRHLIHHTSGLRDWGTIATLEGWSRGTRVHTHAHVLDIVSRQRALNYRPGDHYSYTNTGYNLQVMLVERVSGMSFAEFTRTRLFEPLGMAHTEWRDDYARVVKNRALAYGQSPEGVWRLQMPFENVYGNGGLLTTVGDLLRWTRNLDVGEIGGTRFLEAMHRRGVLNSGESIAYASGLREGEYRGVREVSHSGATAGYRGFLTRFPDQQLAVAVMCNAGSANTATLAHAVADHFLTAHTSDEELTTTGIEIPDSQLQARAGRYRDTRTGAPVALVAADGGLRGPGGLLRPVSASRFEGPGGVVLEFTAGGRLATLSTAMGPLTIEPVDEFAPTVDDLTAYVGTYRSAEANSDWIAEIEGNRLALTNRSGAHVVLTPAYTDTFVGGGSAITFLRDQAGQVRALRVGAERVWDLRFERLP